MLQKLEHSIAHRIWNRTKNTVFCRKKYKTSDVFLSKNSIENWLEKLSRSDPWEWTLQWALDYGPMLEMASNHATPKCLKNLVWAKRYQCRKYLKNTQNLENSVSYSALINASRSRTCQNFDSEVFCKTSSIAHGKFTIFAQRCYLLTRRS